MKIVPAPKSLGEFLRSAAAYLRVGFAPDTLCFVDSRQEVLHFGFQTAHDRLDGAGSDEPSAADSLLSSPDQSLTLSMSERSHAQGIAAPELVLLPLESSEQSMLRTAALHSAEERWDIFFRLLWKRASREPGIFFNPADSDTAELMRMIRSVNRDIHKMHAFIRFQLVEDEVGPVYLARYEPDHLILRRASGFFRNRFPNMRWRIETPRGSAAWDGKEIVFRTHAETLNGVSKQAGQQDSNMLKDGLAKDDRVACAADSPGQKRGTRSRASVATNDTARRKQPITLSASEAEAEALWREYYKSTFNPSRVNVRLMKREMPVRFWKNLTEAKEIAELVRTAEARTNEMREALGSNSPMQPADHSGSSFGGSAVATVSSLEEARSLAACCTGCPISRLGTRAIFGEGKANAELMVVGEQPGDEEDRQGRPFVGPAGKLFDAALAEAGLARSEVYVTNAVKHFKFEPRGRIRLHKKPSNDEIALCRHWLDAELRLVKPRLIVCLGNSAARSVCGREVSVTREAGRVLETRYGVPAVISVHPAYVLRSGEGPERKMAHQKLVESLQTAAALLMEGAARRKHAAS